MAAFPDLIANDAMFAITSGRASKIISSTPIGQLTRSRTRPSSNSVFRDILPTEAKQGRQGVVHHSRQTLVVKADVVYSLYHQANWQDVKTITTVVQDSCQAQSHEPSAITDIPQFVNSLTRIFQIPNI